MLIIWFFFLSQTSQKITYPVQAINFTDGPIFIGNIKIIAK